MSDRYRLLTDVYIKEYTGSFGVKDKQRCTTSPWEEDESQSEKSDFQILLQVSIVLKNYIYVCVISNTLNIFL